MSESPETTPLSAEEEQSLREHGYQQIGSREALPRLLATLDAARATVPAGTKSADWYEGYALGQSDPRRRNAVDRLRVGDEASEGLA